MNQLLYTWIVQVLKLVDEILKEGGSNKRSILKVSGCTECDYVELALRRTALIKDLCLACGIIKCLHLGAGVCIFEKH